jgi:hypothetical protein
VTAEKIGDPDPRLKRYIPSTLDPCTSVCGKKEKTEKRQWHRDFLQARRARMQEKPYKSDFKTFSSTGTIPTPPLWV